MKKTIIYCLTILIVSCNQKNNNDLDNSSTIKEKKTSLSQKNKNIKKPRTEEEIIVAIREKFTTINDNSKSYKKVIKDLMQESSEGGNLEGYFENDELKKMNLTYYGEMGKLVEEYYFWGNDLFFVFTQDFQYNMPMYIEGSNVNKIEENRYYFNKDQLIRWLDPKKEKVINSKFSQKETEIIKKVEKLKEKINNISTLNHKKNTSPIFDLLQGKWQHITDKTNFLIFEGDHRKEIAGTNTEEWDDEIFILSNKCSNEFDKNNGIEPEKDKYISCLESDLCWYIVEIDKKQLILSYMGRGNTLSYRRTK